MTTLQRTLLSSQIRTAQAVPVMLRSWSVLALGMFAIMLTHSSDDRVVLGRYSTLVAGVLLALLIGAGVAFALSLQFTGSSAAANRLDAMLGWVRARRWARVAIVGAAAFVIGVTTLFFLGDHLPTYAALRAFIAFSVVLFTVGILSGDDGVSVSDRRIPTSVILPLIGIPVIAGVFAAANLPPLMKTDEAFTLSMGIHLHTLGKTSPLIYSGIYPDQYPWGGVWLQGFALWLRTFGDGLVQGRHFILLAGGLSVALTWIAAARLFDRVTAWATALIMAFVVVRLGVLRPDMVAALYLSAALAAYAYARTEKRLLFHGVTGFLIGFAIDAAPMAYLIGFATGIVYLERVVRRIPADGVRAFLPILTLGVGGGLAILAYFITRTGTTWSVLGAARTSNGDVISTYLQGLINRIQSLTLSTDLNTLFTALAPLTILALIGGAVLIMQRKEERGLVVIAALWLGLIPLFSHYFPPFYATHGLPILAMLAGVGITRGLAALIGRVTLPRIAPFLLVGVWLTGWLASLPQNTDSLNDVVETGREIAAILPAGSVVVGAEPYYFGMLDDFKMSFRGGAYEQSSAAILGRAPDDTWTTLAPDFVIFSQNWAQEPARTEALSRYMERHEFRRIGCWQTEAYGLVELYGVLDPVPAVANCP